MFDCKCTRHYAERCQVLSEQVYSQYFSDCKSISMEGVVLERFNKLKPSTIHMAQFYSILSDEIDQGSSTTVTTLCIRIKFILFLNDISIIENHVVSHGWFLKAVSLCIRYLCNIIYCFRILYYYLQSSSGTWILKRCG